VDDAALLKAVAVISLPGRNSRGTGFLVDQGVVLTAYHVVQPAVAGGEIKAHFPEVGLVAATLKESSPADDWVLLSCPEAAAIRPVDLGAPPFPGAPWKTYGFPTFAPDGVSVGGQVRFTGDSRAIQLWCREASNGAEGLSVAGLSGAPCIVDGKAVGFLKTALATEEWFTIGGILTASSLEVLPARIRQRVTPADRKRAAFLATVAGLLEPVAEEVANHVLVDLLCADALETGTPPRERGRALAQALFPVSAATVEDRLQKGFDALREIRTRLPPGLDERVALANLLSAFQWISGNAEQIVALPATPHRTARIRASTTDTGETYVRRGCCQHPPWSTLTLPPITTGDAEEVASAIVNAARDYYDNPADDDADDGLSDERVKENLANVSRTNPIVVIVPKDLAPTVRAKLRADFARLAFLLCVEGGEAPEAAADVVDLRPDVAPTDERVARPITRARLPEVRGK
jgi:trypsin-like peptidase